MKTQLPLWFFGFVAAHLACTQASVGDTTGDLHAPWHALLQNHVANGRVDYSAIKQEPAQLDAYLKTLAATDATALAHGDQLAFWINAYNAFTMKLIIDNIPLKSIRDIRSPWKQKIWRVNNEAYSLDQIEHEILRKQFKEPRIHFAIVCASIGCPDLQNEAFSGSTIDAQLQKVTQAFMASTKHIKTELQPRPFGQKRPVLHMSRIFEWFAADFTDGGQRSVTDFIAQYAPKETAAFILTAGDRLATKPLVYNWSLNTTN